MTSATQWPCWRPRSSATPPSMATSPHSPTSPSWCSIWTAQVGQCHARTMQYCVICIGSTLTCAVPTALASAQVLLARGLGLGCPCCAGLCALADGLPTTLPSQWRAPAGVSPLLQQSNSTLTLMAPTNSAWANGEPVLSHVALHGLPPHVAAGAAASGAAAAAAATAPPLLLPPLLLPLIGVLLLLLRPVECSALICTPGRQEHAAAGAAVPHFAGAGGWDSRTLGASWGQLCSWLGSPATANPTAGVLSTAMPWANLLPGRLSCRAASWCCPTPQTCSRMTSLLAACD